MKKLISLKSSALFIVFLVMFSLIFLFGIEGLSLVQAQGANKPGCSIFAYYDKFDELNEEINALYAQGYRLKEFSVQPVRTNTYNNSPYTDYELKAFAALCKD